MYKCDLCLCECDMHYCMHIMFHMDTLSKPGNEILIVLITNFMKMFLGEFLEKCLEP